MIVYVFFARTMVINDREVTLSQTIEEVERSLRNKMSNAERASDMVFGSALVQKILSSGKGSVQTSFSEWEELNSLVNTLEMIGDVKINLYVPDNKFYAHEHSRYYPLSEAENEKWYVGAVELEGKEYWTYSIDEKTISLVRLIKNHKNYLQTLGAVRILLDISNIEDIITAYDLEGIYLSVVDSEGIMICTNNNSFSELIGTDCNSILFAHGYKDAYCKEIENTQWKIVMTGTLETVGTDKAAILIIVMLSISMILLYIPAMIIISAFVMRSIARQINEVTECIEKNRDINDWKLLQSEKKAAGRIGHSVSGIMADLHRVYVLYINSVEREYIANMRLLQEQINPHFLYNTLNMINLMAIKYDADDISSVISNLAKYYRLGLNAGKYIVTIEEEIIHAEAYWEIQRARWGNSVLLKVNIPKEMYNYEIPKITLQPVIENALEHGIYVKREKAGTVEINGKTDGEYIVLAVIDNGVGMTPEQVDQVNSCVKDNHSSKNGGYGLYNINERITRFSRDEHCGVSVASDYGNNTTVTIRIKIKEQQAQPETKNEKILEDKHGI